MRILYIWDADYPWDIRVEKICLSLVESGHDLHIAARNLKRQPEYEEAGSLTIHRMPSYNNDKLNYALSFPAFFSPFWKRFLDSIVARQHIDLIIVRDLPMAIAGIWLGKRFNLPVVFDMAEDYVALIERIWQRRKFSGLNMVVRNPYLAKCVERYALKRFDHILVVVDEAKDLVIERGAQENRVTVIGNTPNVKEIEGALQDEGGALFAGKYVAVYTGGIQLGRGLQVVFEAIPEIVAVIPEFLFLIIGDGYAVAPLQEQVRASGVEEFVHWAGWMDHDKLISCIAKSDIGIIPHLRSPHVDTTIPNKVFDYMACAVPVVSVDSPPLKRIVLGEKAGLIFKDSDSSDLARAICTIYRDKTHKYGEKGRSAVYSQYNWANEVAKLRNVISGLVHHVC